MLAIVKNKAKEPFLSPLHPSGISTTNDFLRKSGLSVKGEVAS